MIYSLEGIVIQNSSTELLLAVGPLVMKVNIPLSAAGALAPTGQAQRLYTSLIWKDTGPQLFGFIQPSDVELFEKLQTVSGIGTRHALSLLGHYSPSELASFLQTEDAKALSKVPGIGLKTAQRLIVELKDKAASWSLEAGTSRAPVSSQAQDALKALINLGYNQVQARKMLEKANAKEPATDLGDLITKALQFA